MKDPIGIDNLQSGKSFLEQRESIDLDLDLSRYLLALKRRWLPGASVFIVTAILAAYATSFMKPTYEARGKLLFSVDPSATLIGVAPGIGQLKPLQNNQTPLTTQIEVLYSNPIVQETIKRLNLTNEEGELIESETLKKLINIKIVGATDVIEISYKSSDPKEAADVINTLMEIYIENNIKSNQSTAEAAGKFLIEKQIPQIEAEVKQYEEELRKFKEKYNILDLAQESQSAVLEMAFLNREIASLESQFNGVKSQSVALQNQLNLNLEQAIALNIQSDSPIVQAAYQELQVVEQELANERKRFLDGHPIVVDLERKKAIVTSALEESIEKAVGKGRKIPYGLLKTNDGTVKENAIEKLINAETQSLNLRRQLDSLYKSRSSYQKRAAIIPKLEEQQAKIERKLEVAKSTYELLLTKFQEVEVAKNQSTGNAKIIDKALVPTKGSTGKTKVLGLGILMGMFLGTSSILLLEIRDKSLKTVQEIQGILPYPLLGILPLFSKKTLSNQEYQDWQLPPIIVRDAPESMVSEMYRMIQANLKFLSSDKEVKVITVSSSVPGEGKSTVSANLAAAIAQLGRKVLLVDADLAHPCQHHMWNLLNKEGLSHILAGQAEFSPDTSQKIDKLDILTSGVTPPNTLALLDSQKMASLVETAAQKYDFVIIDAPSLIFKADALTLGLMSDGILLVERPRIVDRDGAIRAKEMLERSNQNVLGLVINGINENESNNYYGTHRFDKSPLNTSKTRSKKETKSGMLSSKNSLYSNFVRNVAATALALSISYLDCSNLGSGEQRKKSSYEDFCLG